MNLFLCLPSVSQFMALHIKKPTFPRLWLITGRITGRRLGTFTSLAPTNSFLRIWRYWNHQWMPQTLLWKFPLMVSIKGLCVIDILWPNSNRTTGKVTGNWQVHF